LLEIIDIHVHYGPQVEAIKGVSLRVDEKEIVAIIGSNGAGKTTILRTVSGLVCPIRGTIIFRNRPIHGLRANKIVEIGISHVPEDRKIFPDQTVKDNLALGAYLRFFHEDSKSIYQEIDGILERFPILGRRAKALAGALSGGEQQMLVIARALMSRPSLLCLDEPSLGLAPALVSLIFRVICELREQGITILLVEQLAYKSLAISDRAYVLETGKIFLEGTSKDLLKNPVIRKAYLGKVVRRD
jgi:branched-chain amino acid transport system ATP-binding protein